MYNQVQKASHELNAVLYFLRVELDIPTATVFCVAS